MSEVPAPHASKHLKWILPLLIILLAGATVAYFIKTKPQASAKPVTEKRWGVNVQAVSFNDAQPEIELYGKVEAPQHTRLSASINADVLAVAAKEGASVQQGDPLVTLDTRELDLLIQQREADLSNVAARVDALEIQHKSNLDSLKVEQSLYQLTAKTVNRYQDLSKRKATSEDQVDNARRTLQQQALSVKNREQAIASYPAQRAQLLAEQQKLAALLASAQLDKARAQVSAPFNGRITQVSTSPGDRVKSGDVLLSLYAEDTLQVRAQIPTRVLATVREALAKGLPLPAHTQLDGSPLKLSLERLGGSVNSGQSGMDVLFSFNDALISPEPGRTLSLTLQLPAQAQLLALPPQALYGTDTLYRIEQGNLMAIPVEHIGYSRSANGEPQVLVRSDALKSGDLIITTQLPNAITGLPVKVAE